MFSMDFKCKGITWVGNIYDKIEAMCLEVDDIMNQDTVKYVENQVQSVGENIKTFCAEVINDLLPPSSGNPVKVKDSDIERTAEIGGCKRLKLDSKNNIKMENAPHKILEVIAPAVMDSSLVSFSSEVPQINHLLPLASACPAKKTDPDFSLNEDKHKNLKVDTRYGFMEENPRPQEGSKVTGAITGDSAQVEDMIDHSLKPGGNIDSAILGQSGPDANVPNAPFVSSVVILENKAMETGVTPSNSILSREPNDTLTTFKTLKESSVESSIHEHDQYKNEEPEAFMTSSPEFGRYYDYDSVELEEADDAVGLGMKNIEVVDNVKLEESCIVVQPFSVSCGERKHRSYKKKIRDAIASRMRSSKKKEYEQLGIWYADVDAEINQQRTESFKPATLTKKSDLKNSLTDELCESDWEIL